MDGHLCQTIVRKNQYSAGRACFITGGSRRAASYREVVNFFMLSERILLIEAANIDKRAIDRTLVTAWKCCWK